MPLPKILTAILVRPAEMAEVDAHRFWGALCRSRWSAPAAFRQAVARLEAQPLIEALAVQLWVDAHAQPWHFVELLELLVRERQLTRQTANQLMEPILATTARDGNWR